MIKAEVNTLPDGKLKVESEFDGEGYTIIKELASIVAGVIIRFDGTSEATKLKSVELVAEQSLSFIAEELGVELDKEK